MSERQKLWRDAYRTAIEWNYHPSLARAFADRFVAKHLKEAA